MQKEVKETKSAGGVVLNNKEEVLVVSQQYGKSWCLPKGHIEEGEDVLEAAKREIYEESGVKQLKYIRDLGSYRRYKIAKDGKEDKSDLKKLTFFLFKTKETLLKPTDPANPEARWVTKEKVADLLTHPKDKEFFLSIKEKI
ncbi:MAG TPA: NUDIX domain-containing protein [Candidatus Paceibacterota bacterium]|jgi:ADP-ribose pyrophosphatase YjhB (NUDIX family)|nr:NUDIX domain-containing protein [Candidatus Paceibacterota bacterium]